MKIRLTTALLIQLLLLTLISSALADEPKNSISLNWNEALDSTDPNRNTCNENTMHLIAKHIPLFSPDISKFDVEALTVFCSEKERIAEDIESELKKWQNGYVNLPYPISY